jgi:hypothetical protein
MGDHKCASLAERLAVLTMKMTVFRHPEDGGIRSVRICLKHLSRYVIPLVVNFTEVKSCVFNEIYGVVILAPREC